MNRRAQFGFLKVLVLIAFIGIIWAMGLAKGISSSVSTALSSGNLNGTESFLIANLNLWIFITLILAAVAAVYFGRATE